MYKREFLARLREGLSGLPWDDVAERLNFFSESIDDRMEDGLTEEEAVEELGPVEEIIAQIIAETPLTRIVREKVRPKRRMQPWEIVLLVLGSPLWLALLIAAFAVVISVYAVLWSLVLSLWAVEAALTVSALAAAASGILLFGHGGLLRLTLFSGGSVLAGLSIFLFFGSRAATRGAAWLTKRIAQWIKSLFVGKESAI
ncbi:MAG: DUF1700 domain-containing protein [Oscillospiraceae bacterium]|nr:DUF1700 domain-containing protein [Oscillospiraceae bacterium]MBR6207976.1 DUF1700 domain-containing protein [Oscillospiraceae bacterium]